MVQTALVIAALLRFATAEGTWDRNSDPIVAGKSESKSFAELKGSLSEYVLENALARLNERPNDVVAHLMGMRGKALSSNLVLVVDDDWNMWVDPVEHVAIDIGYEPLEPCGGDKKEGQISRYVALPPSLSRYSHMDIRCLNLQLCKDQGGLFAEKGFKIPCLYDSQRQLELSYQEEKANLLQDLKTRLKALEETIISAMGKENLNSGETNEAAASVKENTEVKEEETNTTDDQDTPPKTGEDGSLSDMFSDAAENFLDFKDDPFFDADDSESELKSLGQDKEDPYAEPEQESQQEDSKPEAKIGGDWRLRLAVNGVDEFHPDRE